jgi:hypothetical protein
MSSDVASAVVGSYGAYSNAGAAYVFTKSGATWDAGALLGSGSLGSGQFGFSVAMSSDGASVVVGAKGAYDYAGAVYVFTKSGATWSTGAMLGSGSTGSSYFGCSVAMARDGASAVVGAYGAYSTVGAAYVFTKSGATWSTGALLGSGGAVNSQFGFSVAMAGDGASAVVGAYQSYSNYAGAAYVFTKSGASWGTGVLLRSGSAAYDYFGSAVAMARDGSIAVVGAHGAYGSFRGAAYVFTKSGGTWNSGAVLGSGGASFETFGKAVAMSSDGASAVVGVNGAYGNFRGAAYVFTKSGATWSTGALLGSGSGDSQQFGSSVAMSGTGASAVVGAYGAFSRGAAYAFTKPGATWSC